MKGKKVLFIDDSRTTRNMVGGMLQKKGLEVFLAEDGWQGNAVAVAVKPDLILCDIEMPIRDGFETCESIRRIDELKDVPIVVLTAQKGRESFQKAMAAGADDYLLKPFKENELYQKLIKHLMADTTRMFLGKTVLIIEDSKTIRSIMSGMLERMGFKVSLAEDGSQGEAVAKAIVPDMILCDLLMPVKNGYEFCQSVRADKTLKEVPVIVVSSKRGQEQVAKALGCGATDYLVKPFKETDLIEKIQKYIKTGK
ncbi:response regulator [Gemmatimonadota bacterium]